jgi:signal-transduction protein with cAMP-binding, CBS, and nucleotidyltransferase domain
MNRPQQRVSDVMTMAVLTVERNAGAGEVLRHFREYPIHHLPVMEGPRVVGLLSSSDMLPGRTSSCMRGLP